MNILITGATGCLGRHLALLLLQEKNNILVTGRNQNAAKELIQKGAIFKKADLSDKKAILDLCKGQDIVFHCGALSSNWGNYNDFYNANVLGTKNIIEGCKKHNVSRLIYVSTPSIYFDFSDRLNIKESAPLSKKYINHYISTKLLAEEAIDKAFLEGLEVITIRPRAIFGSFDRSIIPRIIRVAQKGKIPLVNDGKALVDITYVGNVVNALILCMKAPKSFCGKKYNITNNEPMPLKTLLSILFKKMGMTISFRPIFYPTAYCLAGLMELFSKYFLNSKEPKLTRYSVGVLAKSQTLDISASKKDLGYKPTISIEQGLDLYVKWWKETYES